MDTCFQQNIIGVQILIAFFESTSIHCPKSKYLSVCNIFGLVIAIIKFVPLMTWTCVVGYYATNDIDMCG